jgi:hypothetical protein
MEMFEEILENKNIVFSSKVKTINEWDNNIFYNVFDVFSEEILSDLKESCDKHFIYNCDTSENLSAEHTFNDIVDCYNFDLTSNSEDPHEEKCWNVFVLTLKNEIIEYLKHSGIDPEKIKALSCNAARLTEYKSNLEYEQYDPYKNMECIENYDIEKIFSAIFYLKKPPNETLGIIINTKEPYLDQIKKDNFYLEYAKENSLFIFQSSLPHNYIMPSPEDLKISSVYTIQFDFFVDNSENKYENQSENQSENKNDLCLQESLLEKFKDDVDLLSREPKIKNIQNLKKNKNILYNSKNRTVSEWDNNIFYNVFDVFSEEIMSYLRKSCEKHFIHNVIVENPKMYFEFTETIIDCHGLALTSSRKYPYEEEWWNVFVLKAKKEVLKYAQISGIDPKIVAPFALWSFRIIEYASVLQYLNHNPYINMRPIEDNGIEHGKKMISAIYYLNNPNENFGILVKTNQNNSVVRNETDFYINYGKENSFFILDSSLHHSFVAPSPEDLKISPVYIIQFDFFINQPYTKAAWEDTIF